MSSRRQTLLARVNGYLQSSLKHKLNKSQVIDFIIEVVVADRFHCTHILPGSFYFYLHCNQLICMSPIPAESLPLFIKQTDVLPQYSVKFRSRECGPRLYQSSSIMTGALVAMLLRCLLNFRAINHQDIQSRGFETSRGLAVSRLSA